MGAAPPRQAPLPPAAVPQVRNAGLALSALLGVAGFAACRYGLPPAVVGAIVAGLGAVGAAGAELLLGRPLDRLARDLLILARDNPRHVVRAGGLAARAGAAAAIAQARIQEAEEGRDAALAAATARLDAQKSRLEALLLDLSEGVILCGPDHQVVLYNQAATGMIDQPHALGLGRPVFDVLSREAVLHQFDRLEAREDRETHAHPFVCATTTGGRLIQARMTMVTEGGYVLTLADAGAQIDRAAKLDRLLRGGIERQRAHLASLQAAAETLSETPDLVPAERAEFERIVHEEAVALAGQNEALARAFGELGTGSWPMAELHTGDLFALLARRLAGAAVTLTQAGVPDWIFGDSLSLIDLLEHLVLTVAREQGAERLTVSAMRDQGMVNLDLIWSGNPVPGAALDAWMEEPLPAGRSIGEARTVLERHATECWSAACGPGEAMIRMPLPSAEPPARQGRKPRPQRPEFYDFDLAARPAVSDALRERSLRALSFVVFDVETTGLKLSDGDEVVSIGAVRVVNGRVLPLEIFSRVVNPGRPIPASSTTYHGLTDADVQDKPPLALVLPQFHRFVGDAVLVAHNAAFDMIAIGRGGKSCGLSFNNPVLDTLLVSAWLDQEEPDHSLDAIAARLGLEVPARHDALGDSLLTAAILVRQIERVEERGIGRFGELAIATDMSARLRQNKLQF